MSRIVCVHGIGQEYKARETLLEEWAPALCGGVSNAGGRLDRSEIEMAFYGVLFRPSGGAAASKGGAGTIPDYAPGDLTAPVERELLESLYEGCKPEAVGTKGATRTLAGMVQVLANTPFFGGAAQRVVIWYLKQVSRYVNDPEINATARQRVVDAIGEDTRIVVGHSLGSVVAWEVLCAKTYFKIGTFITLGSPLGVPALWGHLRPPVHKSVPGTWPGSIGRWTNIADKRDVVALEKRLARVYGPRVEDLEVENGATMHDIRPYLTSRELGRAILEGLA